LNSLPGQGLLGIATSKKIGVTPKRNKVKRRFREAVRLQSLVAPNLDYVLIVKQDAANAPFERIQIEVRTLFDEAKRRWAEESEFS
jgi:ribonuclease P protein component